MAVRNLRDREILIVEDEYMLADDLRTDLGDVGALIVGPVATVEDALQLIASNRNIEAAVLDVNLGGEMVFPVADLLATRHIPFVFTTGYDASTIPIRFSEVARCEKPVKTLSIITAIERLFCSPSRPDGEARDFEA